MIDRDALIEHVKTGWLPLPRSIVPPERPFFLWEALPPKVIRHKFSRFLKDPFLLELKRAFERCLEGIEEVAVWASGGIDSSAALLLASWILGPENVSAIHLDFGYRPDETERVNLVADHLDLRLVVEKMTLDDHLRLLKPSIRNQRSPTDFSTQSLMAAQIAEREGIHTVLSGLGVDEILGGYPAHVKASSGEFANIEARLLWRCQSFYAWVQMVQGASAGVDVRFPFLDTKLIAVSRGLLRAAKVEGRETKILLRRALRGELPEKIVEAGRIAGTKVGFTPSITEWWREGLGEHVKEQIRRVPLPLQLACLSPARYLKMLFGGLSNHWLSLRLSTVPLFLQLHEEGAFIEEPSWASGPAEWSPPITSLPSTEDIFRLPSESSVTPPPSTSSTSPSSQPSSGYSRRSSTSSPTSE